MTHNNYTFLFNIDPELNEGFTEAFNQCGEPWFWVNNNGEDCEPAVGEVDFTGATFKGFYEAGKLIVGGVSTRISNSFVMWGYSKMYYKNSDWVELLTYDTREEAEDAVKERMRMVSYADEIGNRRLGGFSRYLVLPEGVIPND